MRHAAGVWLAIAIVLGSLPSVALRYSMNPDGIAYLDMGDAYFRGDWATAIRSYWSPLYAWLVAAVVRLARPPPMFEFPLVHLANLAIYGLALWAFTFLLREILAARRDEHAATPATIGPPEWAWISLGYAAFVWCTLQYLPLGLVTPDLLVSALVYLCCGLVLWVRRQPRRRRSALLGGLLGLGYLAKAPMLPLAVVFVAASTLVIGDRARRISHLIVASAAMGVVTLPFIVGLSVASGHPTVGDSAMLNYLWFVDGIPNADWQGSPDVVGQPLRHSQLLLEQPAIVAFDSPFPVTFATWYAPDYWFSGATPLFTLPGQVRATLGVLRAYAHLVVDLGGVCAGLAILLPLHSGPWRISDGPALVLLAPALAAFSMYALVHVEARLVAPFVVLLLLGLLMLVRLPRARWSAALISSVSAAVVVVLVLQIGSTSAGLAGAVISQVQRGSLLEPDDQVQVALALRSAGIGPGDAVASGDRAFTDYWARLARVRIVAAVSERDGAGVLDADPAARAAAQRVLVAQNVRAVVARAWPAQTGDPAWRSVYATEYFYYLVPDRS